MDEDTRDALKEFLWTLFGVFGMGMVVGAGVGTALGTLYFVTQLFEKLVNNLLGVW